MRFMNILTVSIFQHILNEKCHLRCIIVSINIYTLPLNFHIFYPVAILSCNLNQFLLLHLSCKSSYVSTCMCLIAALLMLLKLRYRKNVKNRNNGCQKCKCEENKVWKKIIGVNNAFKRWICFLLCNFCFF